MDPAFRLMRSHSMAKLAFYYLFGKNMIFRKELESPLIFVLFFLRENKISCKPKRILFIEGRHQVM